MNNYRLVLYMIKLEQGDCLELMKQLPDSSIDLVLTDPPYGITEATSKAIEIQKESLQPHFR